MTFTAKLPIVEREPNRRGPFLDLTDHVNKHGVRFLRHAGFKKQHAAWECICPLCGTHFVIRGACRHDVQSCGCSRLANPDADRRNWLKKVHENVIVKDCDSDWDDFELFYVDVPKELTQGSLILKQYVHLPYSKHNFRIYHPSIRTTHHCKTFMVDGEPITSVEIADLLGVTRQRVHQLMQHPETLKERIIQCRKRP